MKYLMLIFIMIFGIGCDNSAEILPINSNTTFENIDKGCIEGHSYYRTGSYSHGGIAINLDDDGKPIKCGSKANK